MSWSLHQRFARDGPWLDFGFARCMCIWQESSDGSDVEADGCVSGVTSDMLRSVTGKLVHKWAEVDIEKRMNELCLTSLLPEEVCL